MAAIVASSGATVGHALVDVVSIGQCGFSLRSALTGLPGKQVFRVDPPDIGS
jgi:hypothetical protein